MHESVVQFVEDGADSMKLSNSESESEESNGNTKKLVTASTTNSAEDTASKVLGTPALLSSLISLFLSLKKQKLSSPKFSKSEFVQSRVRALTFDSTRSPLSQMLSSFWVKAR